MNRIIKNHDPHDETAVMVTDIDARFGINDPLVEDRDQEKPGEPEKTEIKPVEPKPEHKPDRRITLSMAEIKHIYNDEVEKAEEEEPEKVSFFSKCCYIIRLPVELFFKAIIPNVDDEKIDAWYTPIIPLTSVIAFLSITKSKFASCRMGIRVPRCLFLDWVFGSRYFGICPLFLLEEEGSKREVLGADSILSAYCNHLS